MTHWEAVAEASGERLDRWLAAALDLPRNQIQRLIREGQVTVNGRLAVSSAPVVSGARITVDLPAPREERVEAEEGELSILFADADLLVVDKPAGLTVHPGAGRSTGTLVHRLLHRFPELAGVGGPGRPGIVHRLDLGTSGVMVLARHPESYQKLSKAFASRRVDKRYLAIAYGTPKTSAGSIEAAIGRHPERRTEMTLRPDGRPALTRWRRLASARGTSLFALEIATGRTHQIRVHLKSLGHPLVGDPVYGEARFAGCPKEVRRQLADFSRPALHAWRLSLEHPRDGRWLSFEAPVPADLETLWLGLAGEPVESVLAGLRLELGRKEGEQRQMKETAQLTNQQPRPRRLELGGG